MKVSAFPNIGTPRGPGSFRTLSREEEDLVKYQYVKPTAAVAAAAVTTVVVSISLPQSLSICNVSNSLAQGQFQFSPKICRSGVRALRQLCGWQHYRLGKVVAAAARLSSGRHNWQDRVAQPQPDRNSLFWPSVCLERALERSNEPEQPERR